MLVRLIIGHPYVQTLMATGWGDELDAQPRPYHPEFNKTDELTDEGEFPCPPRDHGLTGDKSGLASKTT